MQTPRVPVSGLDSVMEEPSPEADRCHPDRPTGTPTDAIDSTAPGTPSNVRASDSNIAGRYWTFRVIALSEPRRGTLQTRRTGVGTHPVVGWALTDGLDA
jgi:hypothetical protein